MADLNESILSSVKKLLNLPEAYTDFDEDIVLHINSALDTIQQLGVGPIEHYEIESKANLWSEFIGDVKFINFVKTAVWLDVRLVFDPPTTSFQIESFQKRLEQLHWRLRVQADKTRPIPVVVVVVDPEIL